ncbi:hypothetical protein B0H13DRAFT_2535658 [Mycena leptocephala]|nr:hypothetical protein B0H13DRAFT_2535658 [Mycena leptocephala]
MSSFNILEFFQLKAGRRVIVNKLNSTYGTHYAHYNTHYLLLADSMAAFPAVPTAIHTYNNQLPDEHTSMVYGVGRVTDSPQTLDDGHGSRAVTVAVSDFACGETNASTIDIRLFNCTLDPCSSTTAQYHNPMLRVVPRAWSYRGSAPSDDTSGSPGSTASAPVTPSKRRKFDPPSLPPSVDSPDSPLASSTSTPSSNVATSMASVADPNARIGPMHYSQVFQQYPQCMPPPTGDLTFQPSYTPYNSRGEYTLPSIDSRTPASTSHPDSADISSASIAPPSTVPVPDNSAVNRSAANAYSYPMIQPSGNEFIKCKYFAIQYINFRPTVVFHAARPRGS